MIIKKITINVTEEIEASRTKVLDGPKNCFNNFSASKNHRLFRQ